MRLRHTISTALLVLLVLPGGARAIVAPPPPQELPPAGASAASEGRPVGAHLRGAPTQGPSGPPWIVGAFGADGRVVAAAARRAGARRVDGLPAYAVSVGRARKFAAQLRRVGALWFSEPDRRARIAQSAGPGSLAQHEGWRDYLFANPLAPPAPGPTLALVDSQAQWDHPAFTGANFDSTVHDPPTDEHGTATAAVAIAADTGLGFEGIFPGGRALNIPTDLTCLDLSRRIVEARTLGAKVLNMSLGSTVPCYIEYLALMEAIHADVLPVVSAGNEYTNGNPITFPAAYPHVLTVGAINPDGSPAFFSSASLGVDVAAPGIGIILPVPVQFDDDGDKDGYKILSGTSFSSPMVAGAALWIRATRPELTGQQVGDLIRGTAKDVYKKGYDLDTGYGLPQIDKAIAGPAPSEDPYEPNDDINLVNGTLWPAAPPVWSGAGKRQIDGFLDSYKNPADVFRVSVPPGATLTVDVRAKPDPVEFAIYPQGARSIRSGALKVARSVRSDRVLRIANRGRRRIYYVAVGSKSIVTEYLLTIRR